MLMFFNRKSVVTIDNSNDIKFLNSLNMGAKLDYMSTNKGIILCRNEPCIRYIIVDYDYIYVYCIDLNSDNKICRKIIKLTYEECSKLRLE